MTSHGILTHETHFSLLLHTHDCSTLHSLATGSESEPRKQNYTSKPFPDFTTEGLFGVGAVCVDDLVHGERGVPDWQRSLRKRSAVLVGTQLTQMLLRIVKTLNGLHQKKKKNTHFRNRSKIYAL